ncbi:hypothetical protein N3K66_005629 [Trichothecium roseum]|uniref:Uncharacterized protein n=1 Tax=Trichothecium roseum TaxID=47278 RepID=A0ACC0UYE3_9HYPO|nr:hypothetical protein N3K66_005629 [Trichothecium roseum]
MAEHDALVLSYRHLADMPRADEALHTLKKVASLVKPIMRARGWKIHELSEFWPSQANLLGAVTKARGSSYETPLRTDTRSGLNVGRGKQVFLRLRYPQDRSQFMPIEEVIDTMLHELCHNVIGPHNAQFNALWDQLRDEHQGLLIKGYTGEGFLSEGRRLGGARIPLHEARRIARSTAEEQRARPSRTTPTSASGFGSGPGRRLGGAKPRPGEDIRRVIADAVERRNATLRGCGTERLNDSQVRDISDSVARNGFRTKADEDEANESAIAQALWELTQEDEKAKHGESYIEPSPANPAGSRGSPMLPGRGSQAGPSTSEPAGSSRAFDSTGADEWTCQVCTLVNPTQFLCCNACGGERSLDSMGKVLAEQNRASSSSALRGSSSRQKAVAAIRDPVVIDLTESPPRHGRK